MQPTKHFNDFQLKIMKRTIFVKVMISLSAVIITYNEEKNIARCLKSLDGIADEIVVVDSYSKDRTKSICEAYDVVFIEHPFEGHIQQKNYALTQACNNYCISLDADEELTPQLKQEILDVKNNWEFDGYYINRLTNYCGQWIKHCGWYPDWKLRLFDRRKGHWTGKNPHDEYVLKTGQSTRLKGNLNHYSFDTINQHLKQIDYFTDISASVELEKGTKVSSFKIWYKSRFKFFRDYILKLGFLDGKYGYIVCKNSAMATAMKYQKLKQLKREVKK